MVITGREENVTDDAASLLLVVSVMMLYAALLGGPGALIGNFHNQARAGFCLGLLLGPLGWLIAALLPTHYDHLCRTCRGGVPPGARRCMHCGESLGRGGRVRT